MDKEALMDEKSVNLNFVSKGMSLKQWTNEELFAIQKILQKKSFKRLNKNFLSLVESLSKIAIYDIL